ncbi:DUF6301 family protein [Nocardia fluminea]
MQADIEGAASIARLAAGFNWQWTTENAAAFYRSAGWRVEYSSDTFALLRVSPGQQSPVAKASYDSEFLSLLGSVADDLQEVFVVLTDPASIDSAGHLAELTDLFVDLSNRLTVDLGKPVDFSPGRYATLRWDLPNVVLRLTTTESTLSFDIVNPVYQRWLDRQAATSEETDEMYSSDNDDASIYSGSETWSDYVKALAMSLPRMGSSSFLRLRVNEHRIIAFEMKSGQLTMSVPSSSITDASVSIPGDICAQCDWFEYDDQQGGGWRYSVGWPARYREYELMAACATAILRENNSSLLPSGVHLEAWAYDDVNTPDTSALGRPS